MPTLQFKGKVFVQNHHLAVPFHELQPVKAKGLSQTPSLHDNVIVQGDNLAALKALLPTYHGKVKCIYIDCRVAFKSGILCALKTGLGQKTGTWSRTLGVDLGSGA
jgi:hypothetical protein